MEEGEPPDRLHQQVVLLERGPLPPELGETLLAIDEPVGGDVRQRMRIDAVAAPDLDLDRLVEEDPRGRGGGDAGTAAPRR